MPKMLRNSKIDCGRRKGHLRKRWTDDLKNDLRSLGRRNWKAKVVNRNERKAVVRDGKVQFTRPRARKSGTLCHWSVT